MNKYKIVYCISGNIDVAEVDAESIDNARYWFEMYIKHDDIISISEVSDSVY